MALGAAGTHVGIGDATGTNAGFVPEKWIDDVIVTYNQNLVLANKLDSRFHFILSITSPASPTTIKILNIINGAILFSFFVEQLMIICQGMPVLYTNRRYPARVYHIVKFWC